MVTGKKTAEVRPPEDSNQFNYIQKDSKSISYADIEQKHEREESSFGKLLREDANADVVNEKVDSIQTNPIQLSVAEDESNFTELSATNSITSTLQLDSNVSTEASSSKSMKSAQILKKIRDKKKQDEVKSESHMLSETKASDTKES